MYYHLDERVLKRSQASRELAIELAGCDSCLILSLRINQIANRLSLSQIYPSVEESAKSEFAGLGQPRSFFDGDLQHAPENYRASVAAYFDCVFAGVGMRALVISDYDLINGFIREGID